MVSFANAEGFRV